RHMPRSLVRHCLREVSVIAAIRALGGTRSTSRLRAGSETAPRDRIQASPPISCAVLLRSRVSNRSAPGPLPAAQPAIRAGSEGMMMSGGGADILRAVVVPGGGDDAWPELAGRFEQRAAQVLQQAQAVAGHGQAAGGAVQHGPDQGRAAGISWPGTPA